MSPSSIIAFCIAASALVQVEVGVAAQNPLSPLAVPGQVLVDGLNTALGTLRDVTRGSIAFGGRTANRVIGAVGNLTRQGLGLVGQIPVPRISVPPLPALPNIQVPPLPELRLPALPGLPALPNIQIPPLPAVPPLPNIPGLPNIRANLSLIPPSLTIS